MLLNVDVLVGQDIRSLRSKRKNSSQWNIEVVWVSCFPWAESSICANFGRRQWRGGGAGAGRGGGGGIQSVT